MSKLPNDNSQSKTYSEKNTQTAKVGKTPKTTAKYVHKVGKTPKPEFPPLYYGRFSHFNTFFLLKTRQGRRKEGIWGVFLCHNVQNERQSIEK